ncbi:hypothetical protein chiPu_0000505 [Chiloscyllium punctatum]|uniref:Uncharacterized protein n=1 Tax=Chiloscyllium punctatum TaxID=137246 RepID=A0A401RVD6_CHIPU|nr:hypothetical protein [Chiloscyllium punctatum]
MQIAARQTLPSPPSLCPSPFFFIQSKPFGTGCFPFVAVGGDCEGVFSLRTVSLHCTLTADFTKSDLKRDRFDTVSRKHSRIDFRLHYAFKQSRDSPTYLPVAA